MTSSVQIVAVPSADTSQTCLVLHNDRRSYLFGRVSENTQRAFSNRKVNLARTEHVFLSGCVGWDQLGGLPGYLLSLGGAVNTLKMATEAENQERERKGARSKEPRLTGAVGIHAGDNISHALAALRATIYRQAVKVTVHEQREDPRAASPDRLKPDFEDDAIKVWKLPIRRARSSSPLKRRRPSSDAAGGEAENESGSAFKNPTGVSDPGVAAALVEKIMFNGVLDVNKGLLPKKVSLLKPTDVAVIKEDGILKMYTGPYATQGTSLPNPDQTAWVVPEDDKSLSRSIDYRNSLQLNTHPLPPTAYSEIAMSYIVKGQDRRGKVDAQAVKALGVEPRLTGILVKGGTVEGKDGITVTPDMVMGDPLPGNGIIVADIPSPDFLDAFMDRPEWEEPQLMGNIAAMYWLLGPNMSHQIQGFIERHPQIRHVICAEDTCPNMITNPGGASLLMQLRRIDPERFPILDFDNTVKTLAPKPDSQVEFGRVGQKMFLSPRVVVDDGCIVPFTDLLAVGRFVTKEVLSLARKAKAEATDAKFLARIEEDEQDIPNRDAEVIPLGTGSSVPSKHRNVSSTLIRVPGIGNYLLDCGEGTLGQIRRLFGPEETANVLRDLKCIVISHLHADHHMGTTSLIKAWYEQSLKDNSSAKLAVSCISRFRMLLEELSQVEDIGFHRLHFPSCPGPNHSDKDLTTSKDLGADNFGLARIKRIPVPHCWKAFATELELVSGLRIAYSGDCRPSRDFAQACRGAHLLVHECTFDDDMQEHAVAKRHSTMAEALGVAREMRARRTLLTHFSQRYNKADSLKREGQGGDDGRLVVLLGFDFMRVRLGDFQKAACYLPVIQRHMENAAD